MWGQGNNAGWAPGQQYNSYSGNAVYYDNSGGSQGGGYDQYSSYDNQGGWTGYQGGSYGSQQEQQQYGQNSSYDSSYGAYSNASANAAPLFPGAVGSGLMQPPPPPPPPMEEEPASANAKASSVFANLTAEPPPPPPPPQVGDDHGEQAGTAGEDDQAEFNASFNNVNSFNNNGEGQDNNYNEESHSMGSSEYPSFGRGGGRFGANNSRSRSGSKFSNRWSDAQGNEEASGPSAAGSGSSSFSRGGGRGGGFGRGFSQSGRGSFNNDNQQYSNAGSSYNDSQFGEEESLGEGGQPSASFERGFGAKKRGSERGGGGFGRGFGRGSSSSGGRDEGSSGFGRGGRGRNKGSSGFGRGGRGSDEGSSSFGRGGRGRDEGSSGFGRGGSGRGGRGGGFGRGGGSSVGGFGNWSRNEGNTESGQDWSEANADQGWDDSYNSQQDGWNNKQETDNWQQEGDESWQGGQGWGQDQQQYEEGKGDGSGQGQQWGWGSGGGEQSKAGEGKGKWENKDKAGWNKAGYEGGNKAKDGYDGGQGAAGGWNENESYGGWNDPNNGGNGSGWNQYEEYQGDWNEGGDDWNNEGNYQDYEDQGNQGANGSSYAGQQDSAEGAEDFSENLEEWNCLSCGEQNLMRQTECTQCGSDQPIYLARRYEEKKRAAEERLRANTAADNSKWSMASAAKPTEETGEGKEETKEQENDGDQGSLSQKDQDELNRRLEEVDVAINQREMQLEELKLMLAYNPDKSMIIQAAQLFINFKREMADKKKEITEMFHKNIHRKKNEGQFLMKWTSGTEKAPELNPVVEDTISAEPVVEPEESKKSDENLEEVKEDEVAEKKKSEANQRPEDFDKEAEELAKKILQDDSNSDDSDDETRKKKRSSKQGDAKAKRSRFMEREDVPFGEAPTKATFPVGSKQSDLAAGQTSGQQQSVMSTQGEPRAWEDDFQGKSGSSWGSNQWPESRWRDEGGSWQYKMEDSEIDSWRMGARKTSITDTLVYMQSKLNDQDERQYDPLSRGYRREEAADRVPRGRPDAAAAPVVNSASVSEILKAAELLSQSQPGLLGPKTPFQREPPRGLFNQSQKSDRYSPDNDIGWNPKAVKDYSSGSQSSGPSSFSSNSMANQFRSMSSRDEMEFRPKTFDWGHNKRDSMERQPPPSDSFLGDFDPYRPRSDDRYSKEPPPSRFPGGSSRFSESDRDRYSPDRDRFSSSHDRSSSGFADFRRQGQPEPFGRGSSRASRASSGWERDRYRDDRKPDLLDELAAAQSSNRQQTFGRGGNVGGGGGGGGMGRGTTVNAGPFGRGRSHLSGPPGPPPGGMDFGFGRHMNQSRGSPGLSQPPPGPPVQPPQPKPSKVVINVDEIVKPPGRYTRPPRLVVILRGLPGSGKSYIAKMLKEKEVEQGADPPRTMALDDYFMSEDKYEYEPSLEGPYRENFIKSFKKNIDRGIFPFLIVDAVNDKVDHFNPMWAYAKQNGFEVYVCDVEGDVKVCAERNIHSRTESEIKKLKDGWEKTPNHMKHLDITQTDSSAKDDEVVEVEKEKPRSSPLVKTSSEAKEGDAVATSEDQDDDNDSGIQGFGLKASKWEIMDREERMARLDGTGEKVKTKLAQHASSIEEWLEIGDSFNKKNDGKKRVRWADIEERKQQRKMKEMGFMIGRREITDQDEADAAAESKLTATKIIPNRFHSEFHN